MTSKLDFEDFKTVLKCAEQNLYKSVNVGIGTTKKN